MINRGPGGRAGQALAVSGPSPCTAVFRPQVCWQHRVQGSVGKGTSIHLVSKVVAFLCMCRWQLLPGRPSSPVGLAGCCWWAAPEMWFQGLCRLVPQVLLLENDVCPFHSCFHISLVFCRFSVVTVSLKAALLRTCDLCDPQCAVALTEMEVSASCSRMAVESVDA